MRILGHVVVRNEFARWLDCSLTYNGIGLSGLFVYDDQSDDGTTALAEDRHCVVERRPDGVASFIQHEGSFRQAAWEAFQRRMNPEPGDWVLAFDADEILIPSMDSGQLRVTDTFPRLHEICVDAASLGALAVNLPIFEVFSVAGDGKLYDDPKVRTDGYWNQISAPRLFRYQAGGVLPDHHFGCGSVPNYITRSTTLMQTDMALLHLGYALPEDQLTKYERYIGNDGHSSTHVQSILGPRQLAPWHGPKLKVWRGRP